jgi:hypothetical protein
MRRAPRVSPPPCSRMSSAVARQGLRRNNLGQRVDGLLELEVALQQVVWSLPKARPTSIVRRADRDGLAFFFTADHERRVATLLAQVAGAPPALGASTRMVAT